MLIFCRLNQAVKLHSIKIVGNADGPKTVKTYINRPAALSFDDFAPPIEVLTLTADDLKADTPPLALRFVKYQSVGHLTLFVEDNQSGDDVTVIQEVRLYGTPLLATKDLSELKKEEHDH